MNFNPLDWFRKQPEPETATLDELRKRRFVRLEGHPNIMVTTYKDGRIEHAYRLSETGERNAGRYIRYRGIETKI